VTDLDLLRRILAELEAIRRALEEQATSPDKAPFQPPRPWFPFNPHTFEPDPNRPWRSAAWSQTQADRA